MFSRNILTFIVILVCGLQQGKIEVRRFIDITSLALLICYQIFDSFSEWLRMPREKARRGRQFSVPTASIG